MAAQSSSSSESALDILNHVAHGPVNQVGARGSSRDTRDATRDILGQATGSTPESSIASLVYELFDRAREARRGQMQTWKRNYHALNNRAYKPSQNAWDEAVNISSIWPPVASSVAWMTDQRPITEVTPVMPPFSPYADWYQSLADDMNTALKSGFISYSLSGEISRVLWDVFTYGIGYYKNQWEAPLADGLGDATFRRVDPFTVYPDPHARNEASLNYIIEARTMTVADAERAWPGASRKLNFNFQDDNVEQAPHALDDTVDDRKPRVALAALTPGGGFTNAEGPRGTRDTPVITVLEAYIRGSLFDKTDDPGVTRVRDDWRCVIVSGNTVLMDSPCTELNAFGEQPYTRQVLMDTGEWYGPCIVEMLVPIQRIINWLLGSINRNIYLMGNPVLLEDPRAVSRNRKFTSRPGQRLEAYANQAQWLSPPQLHPQLSADLVRYYKSEIESITGLSAMVRGFTPTGRNAQGVLDSVQDAAFVRVRSALRELERSLQIVSMRQAATIAEFYTEPRIMSLVGPDGQRTYNALRARHFYAVDEDNPTERIPLRFTIIADAGSQLLTSKQARANQAVELYKLGALDDVEVLKAQEWPNYARVAQRVMQLRATQPEKKKG